MSETLRATPPVGEAPTCQIAPARQLIQENVFGLTGWRVGEIIPDFPLRDMRLYEPRWVWPPTFKPTEHYRRRRKSIEESGVFNPLLVLPDGQVVDGQHRYSCAMELGLESVPVRVIEAPLPLSEADQLAIEDWAVYDAVARRHLTPAQATQMLYDLLRGRSEVWAKIAGLANLQRGREKSDLRPDPSHLTVKELATRADKSLRSVERAVTVLRHAPPEIQEQLRSGALTLGAAERAMKAALAAKNGPAPATASPAKTPRAKPVEVPAAPASPPSNGASAATTGTEVPKGLPPAPAPTTEEPSPFTPLAEAFIDSARALVRKAHTWNREALDRLSRALGQIETSLRDGGARARAELRA
jgi:ParB-like chromosome segregation protein Spo0J